MLRSLLIIVAVIAVAATAAFVTANRHNYGHKQLVSMKTSLVAGSRGSLALFGAQGGNVAFQKVVEPGDGGNSADEPPGNDDEGSSSAQGGDEGSQGGDEGTEGDDGSGGGDEGTQGGDEGNGGGDEGTQGGDEGDGGGDEGTQGGDEGNGGGDDSTAAGDEGAAGDEEATGDEEGGEEEAPTDPIEKFKNLDPRDIITMKYDDLEGRKTEPWNEESEQYIPNTGRVDPLTRVRESVPDDLKPPRAGESDQNQISTYEITAQATADVDMVSAAMQCYNVVQIGLDRFATFSMGGDSDQAQTFTLREGGGFTVNLSAAAGVLIMTSVTVTSIKSNKVVVDITATGQGTTTSVTKTKVFIPSLYQ